jgi:hypothetical protein
LTQLSASASTKFLSFSIFIAAKDRRNKNVTSEGIIEMNSGEFFWRNFIRLDMRYPSSIGMKLNGLFRAYPVVNTKLYDVFTAKPL